MAFNAIVIGTGFGGTIAAVQLVAKGKPVLIGRGTFGRSSYPIAMNQGGARPDHRKGLTDFVAAPRNVHNDGLYQYSRFGQAGVPTASGAGGLPSSTRT